MKSVLITLSDSINSSSLPPPVKPPVDGMFVKLAALIAGKTAGNLASGIVPEVKFVAFNWVRSTGKLVKFAPSPVKDVAVTPPLIVWLPVNVLLPRPAKLPVAVTPPCQVPPL